MAPDPTIRVSEAGAGAGGSYLAERYAAELAARRWEPDPAQLPALARLETLRSRLLATQLRGPIGRWLDRRRAIGAPAQSGLYLYGGVGRGKTWLMDLFYDSLGPLPRSRRHFHHFMREVHARLRALPAQRAPLEAVAAAMAGRARVLCLDELYVADIADAMLLGGLFEALLRRGMSLVITSNLPPSELYREGLQRSRFLPAIALLERALEVLRVDGGIDYRLQQLRTRPIYFDSAAPDSDGRLRQLFEALAGDCGEQQTVLQVQQRSIRALARRGEVVWFDFATLCEGQRSANDYVEIAAEFRTVLVGGVPVFATPAQDDAARRFIALIDEFYDQGVKLVLSAAAPPAALYRQGRLQREFERASSRLTEMQTETYLARPHRPAQAPAEVPAGAPE